MGVFKTSAVTFVRTFTKLSSVPVYRTSKAKSYGWQRLVTLVAVTGSTAYYYLQKHKVSAAFWSSKIETSGWMSDPITDVEELEQNSKEMRSKMEQLVMRIQVKNFTYFSKKYLWLALSGLLVQTLEEHGDG